MPDISTYDELSLVGMEIDDLGWTGNRLRANFGDGYGASAVNGNANGLHRWAISSQALPDDADYGDLIAGVPRFQYYWDFFKDHTTGANDVFLIEWRGRKYFAEFVDNTISPEMHTIDLFGAGVEIRQRRVTGFYEGTDGSAFDPSYHTASMYAWFDETSPNYGGAEFTDISGNSRHFDINGDVITGGATQNGLATAKFNSAGANGYINLVTSATFYDVFMVLKVREATFSTYQGVLSASATDVAMVGNNGDTKLLNLTHGAGYTFYKNSTLLTEATQNMPMNTFGMIHGRWPAGITLLNPQIGKDRADAARMLKADIGEIVLFSTAISAEVAADMRGWLLHKWGIS